MKRLMRNLLPAIFLVGGIIVVILLSYAGQLLTQLGENCISFLEKNFLYVIVALVASIVTSVLNTLIQYKIDNKKRED